MKTMRDVDLTTEEKELSIEALQRYSDAGPYPDEKNFGFFTQDHMVECLQKALKQSKYTQLGLTLVASILYKIGDKNGA